MASGFNVVGLEDNGRSERKGTVLTASFHILTTVIGYGILSLPRAIAQLGWITGPALILLFAFVPYYTSTLLSVCYSSGNENCGQRTSTYIDVARSNLGGTKFKIFLGVYVLYLFEVGVVYTTASSAIMKQILSSTHCSDNGSKKNPCHVKLNQQMIVFGIIQFIFSQFPDQLSILTIINVITTFIYSAIGVGLSINRVGETGKFRGSLSGIRTSKVTAIEKMWRSFLALGDIAFAYIFSNTVIEIQNTLKSPPSEAKTMKKACQISLGVTTLLYMLSGCFGYAAFGDSARENFLDGFVKPHWLLEIANAAIVLHLICSYQAYCQPLFAFVEKTAVQKYPDSQFITRNFEVPRPGSGTYKLNLFRSILRTIFVIITTVVAMTMRLTFFKDAISFVGAWGFWPLTVHFPVEIYIEQKQIIKWSREWIWLQMLSFVCLIVTIAAVVGSIAGIVLDF